MARAKGRDTWRSKEWYDILAPSIFGSSKIGETLASDPEKVMGRVIETTLGDLIDDYSKSHIKVSFKVVDIEDHEANTDFIGHDMSREYIRSQVRRRTTKVDIITEVTTSDGAKLQITAMAATLDRVQTGQKESVHREMEDYIKSRSKEFKFDQLAQQIVLGKMASEVYRRVRKVCPIRRVEIKKSKVLEKGA